MCKTLAGYLEILKGLILAHPTVTMRTIMRNAYIYAQAGLDSIEMFACYPLSKDQYRIMPRNDTRTEYIPVTCTYLHSTHEAYLDLTTNSLRATTPARSCLRSNNRILMLDNLHYKYDRKTGVLAEITTLDTLSLASATVNFTAIEIPEVIFRKPSLIDWPQMSEYHALQDIYSTVTK